MRADYRVLLDACVLIPMPLADTLLRMAEEPRLYVPKWSQLIMDEVTRSLIEKWDLEPEKARRRQHEIRRHFPEAWIEGFEPLLEVMTNDPKDRHVLAAAVRSHCELIVTYKPPPLPRRGGSAMGDRSSGAIRISTRTLRSRRWPIRPQAARAGASDRNQAGAPPAEPTEECSELCSVLLRRTTHPSSITEARDPKTLN